MARWVRPWFVLCITVGLLAPAIRADEPLAKKLEAVMDGPDYKHSHWGLLAVDAKTGETVYARNPDMLFTPASTTKLFSCAAALITYGPDYRFHTPVYSRGPVIGKTLRGDLFLVASGDLTLGGRTGPDGKVAYTDGDHIYANSGLGDAILPNVNPLAGLESLAAQVKKAGITTIEGEVLVDDRLFARAEGTGSGPSAVTPIMVNDNVIDVIVTPGAKPGDLAKVEMRPQTQFAQMDAEVTTDKSGVDPTVMLQATGTHHFTVRGKVPAGGKAVVRVYPIDNPALFARFLFIEALRKQGVRVMAPLVQPSKFDYPDAGGYRKLTKVAEFVSPPFAETIAVTLKVSHNLYASAMPCLIAADHDKRTLMEGLHEQRKILKKLGVDVNSISIGGGAGGSPADCITPRAVAQLLTGLAKRPEWPAFKAGLPILGVDGTLATAVPKDSPARGKVFAKTGTWIWTDVMNERSLLRSKAVAGVMTTCGGRELYFAIYVNEVPLPSGVTSTRVGKTLGKLCEILQASDEPRAAAKR